MGDVRMPGGDVNDLGAEDLIDSVAEHFLLLDLGFVSPLGSSISSELSASVISRLRFP